LWLQKLPPRQTLKSKFETFRGKQININININILKKYLSKSGNFCKKLNFIFKKEEEIRRYKIFPFYLFIYLFIPARVCKFVTQKEKKKKKKKTQISATKYSTYY